MMERRPNTQTVQWFLEAAAQGQLQLDPPFQRRTVWSDNYRKYFIDTVLRNYPSPAIFLAWRIKPGRPTIYDVVDGKQRLSAILDFTNDGFHLGDLFAGEGKADAYWSDLGEELQGQFVNYVFTVENITGASTAELREAFDRLNRNVARLAAQELRHAQFDGLFARRMESLAEEPFWTDVRLATPANVRRMRDVEFISELFVLTMVGVVDGASDVLDGYYAANNEEFEDEDLHLSAFDANLEWIRDLPVDWSATRWNNMTDFYSLWGAVDLLREEDELPDPQAAATALTAFSDTQAAINKAVRAGKKPPGKRADQRYYDATRQGPNKDANRETRVQVLVGLLRAA